MAHRLEADWGVINLASASMRNAYFDKAADELEAYHEAIWERISTLEIENDELRVGKSKWKERD